MMLTPGTTMAGNVLDLKRGGGLRPVRPAPSKPAQEALWSIRTEAANWALQKQRILQIS